MAFAIHAYVNKRISQPSPRYNVLLKDTASRRESWRPGIRIGPSSAQLGDIITSTSDRLVLTHSLQAGIRHAPAIDMATSISLSSITGRKVSPAHAITPLSATPISMLMDTGHCL
jgi:hypothetical protein